MKCPRCDDSALDEKDRDGVTVDVCRVCRGLWLDRGELEKLIARTSRELDEYEGRRTRDDDGDADDIKELRRRRWSAQAPLSPRKRTWLENLGNSFD
ncbi:MAG: zf-TFIIB domain-containing protein [Planctomycetes bacterium]|nr:zf-TFIIB domain-containing protein [Planctomycetota bacterium]